ncbi:MAG TPA: dihydroorotase [Rhodospirillaceae bacterium]|nr:dihydroorotase [Rhodospirillaceae bacterium]
MSTLPSLTLPKPDDWHLHLRDGAMMKAVLPYTARHFARAVVMPNLKPAVTTTAAAQAYRERIRQALPPHMTFTPLMTAYLTDKTDPDDLERGYNEGILFAAKLYPAGVTTNSEDGVTDIQAISHILDRLQKIGMPLLIHGEVADPAVDFFDRETVFIDRVLIPMRRNFPELKVVLEHITTRHAAEYIVSEAQISGGKLAATITAHHLLINRNAMFEGGMHPHHFCLPIVKSETDRQAIIMAATSGAQMFFAGTDSAPHPRTAKESARGSGGIFSAPNALAIYAQIFDEAGALDRLENFLCLNGPAFYDLPVNAATITLEKLAEPAQPLKPILTEEGQEILAFPAESPLSWRVVEKELL